MRELNIGNRTVGAGWPTMIVAEIGNCHNGRYDYARQMLDRAAMAGAHMVKVQMRTPSALATADYLDRPFAKCRELGRTQREVREKLELEPDALIRLQDHASACHMGFASSVFDIPALERYIELCPDVIKIASHSITNGPLLEACAATRLPIIASIGGCTWDEEARAIDILQQAPGGLAIMHCVAAYPCPDEHAALGRIAKLKETYPHNAIGYSDHCEGIDIAIAAVGAGADIIEKHVTNARSMLGLDHSISIEFDELEDLVLSIRRIDRATTRPGAKHIERSTRENYHVAIVAACDIPANVPITRDMLTCKQPLGTRGVNFTGLDMAMVVGKTATYVIHEDTAIPRAAIT